MIARGVMGRGERTVFQNFMQFSQTSASWAAALGTTFAACVALWLGLSESRRRENERLEGMLLIASGVSAYLDELIIELKSASLNIGEALRQRMDIGNRKELIARSKNNLAKLDLDHLSREELSALSALPNGTSEKIYVGLTCAKLVKGALARRGEIAELDDPDADVVLERWHAQASYAVSMFEEALRECHKHARIKLLNIPEQGDVRQAGSP